MFSFLSCFYVVWSNISPPAVTERCLNINNWTTLRDRSCRHAILPDKSVMSCLAMMAMLCNVSIQEGEGHFLAICQYSF